MEQVNKLAAYLSHLMAIGRDFEKALASLRKGHFVPGISLDKMRPVHQSTEVFFRAFTLTPRSMTSELDYFLSNQTVIESRKLMQFYLQCGLKNLDNLSHLVIPDERINDKAYQPWVELILNSKGHCHELAMKMFSRIRENPKVSVNLYYGFIDVYTRGFYQETVKHSFLVFNEDGKKVIYDPLFSIREKIKKIGQEARNYCGFPMPYSFIEKTFQAKAEGKTSRNFSGYLTDLILQDSKNDLDEFLKEIKNADI